MRKGKTEQPVFEGSVKNRIGKRRPETLSMPNESACGAVLGISGSTAVSAGVLAETTDDDCYYAFYRALNSMAACGADACAVTLNILMPEGTDKDELKEYIDRFEALSEKENVDIADVRPFVSGNVRRSVFTVGCIGSLKVRSALHDPQKELSVIMTKYAGIEGTSILSHLKEKELLARFGRFYLEGAQALKEKVPAVRDAKAALSEMSQNAEIFMYAASEGGMFSALWDIAKGFGCGLEIDLRAIPVLQETIEICESFSLNPYELSAGGSLLILTDEPESVLKGLDGYGICSSVIGRTRTDPGKLLINGGRVSNMNRPSQDALFGIE